MATGVVGTTVAGRSAHVWAVAVPATLPEVRVRATGPDGDHVLDVVQQQEVSGSTETRFDPDQAALTAAPALATGTVDGSTWTLRGAVVGGTRMSITGVGTTVPAPATPCVLLSLGAREASGVVCDGPLGGGEPEMAMDPVELIPAPLHAVLALVEDDVARYELGMADGSTRSVDAVEIPGSGGRRAVALVVGSEEQATSLTVVRTDGRRGAPIRIELSGERRSNVQFGHHGGSFSADGTPPTTVVAADLPSLATSVPTTAP